MRDVLLPVGVALALAFTIQAALAKPYKIPTASMDPTIHPGERIIANRMIYRVRDIERGDIVVFDPPPAARRTCPAGLTGDTPLVKRVIGLPGDQIAVRGGLTYVNGEVYEVPGARTPQYLFPSEGEGASVTVPPGRIFVLGDNRPDSCDSSQWRDAAGRPAPWVPIRNVIGQAEILYWPPLRAGFLD